MTVSILVLFIILFIIIIAVTTGGAVWFALHTRYLTQGKKTPGETGKVERPTFRWSYITLPIAFLLLAIILAAYFYHLLPAEVATHFKLDGTPDKWLSRPMSMVWVLTPQFLLALLAGGIVWGVTKLIVLPKQAESAWIKPQRILSFMGNMIALPQLIVCFAMLNIFSYNSYQRHIMPMWIFLLIILGLATIALGIFLARTISKAKQQPN